MKKLLTICLVALFFADFSLPSSYCLADETESHDQVQMQQQNFYIIPPGPDANTVKKVLDRKIVEGSLMLLDAFGKYAGIETVGESIYMGETDPTNQKKSYLFETDLNDPNSLKIRKEILIEIKTNRELESLHPLSLKIVDRIFEEMDMNIYIEYNQRIVFHAVKSLDEDSSQKEWKIWEYSPGEWENQFVSYCIKALQTKKEEINQLIDSYKKIKEKVRNQNKK